MSLEISLHKHLVDIRIAETVPNMTTLIDEMWHWQDILKDLRNNLLCNFNFIGQKSKKLCKDHFLLVIC